MIVIVSDLHLQHTSNDVIRRRAAAGVLECGVRRNVDASALRLLFDEIAASVRSCGAESVDLVLAGDILEIHRTPAWFFGGSPLRPTVDSAAASAELEQKVAW